MTRKHRLLAVLERESRQGSNEKTAELLSQFSVIKINCIQDYCILVIFGLLFKAFFSHSSPLKSQHQPKRLIILNHLSALLQKKTSKSDALEPPTPLPFVCQVKERAGGVDHRWHSLLTLHPSVEG